LLCSDCTYMYVYTHYPLISILIFSYLCLCLPSDLFLSGFPTEILCAFVFCPIHATCLAHHSLLDLMTWMMFVAGYKSWSFSLCSSSRLQVFPIGPDISLAPYSQTSSACVLPLMWDTKFHLQLYNHLASWLGRLFNCTNCMCLKKWQSYFDWKQVDHVNYLSIRSPNYRVFHWRCAKLQDLIIWVILKKRCYINICLITNHYTTAVIKMFAGTVRYSTVVVNHAVRSRLCRGHDEIVKTARNSLLRLTELHI
jgi:hypothetical protein